MSPAVLRRATVIVLTTVFLDVVGLGIIIPVLPFYVAKVGAIAPGPDFKAHSTLAITLLFSVYSLLGFLSSPLLGALSDRKGRRPILIVSLAGSCIGWLIFGTVERTAPWLSERGLSLGWPVSTLMLVLLFLGRSIDGFTSGNYATAQSCLMDLAPDATERAKAFGKVAAVFGLGFILGPAIGAELSGPETAFGHLLGLVGLSGFQAHLGLSTPFLATALLAGVNTVSALAQLPETHALELRSQDVSINPLRPVVKALSNPVLAPGFVAWFLYSAAFTGTFQGPIFSLYMQRRFDWTASNVGMVLVMVGVLGALNQAVLIPRFWLPRFAQSRLEIGCYSVISALYVLMPFVPLWAFMVLIAAWSTLSGVARVVTNAQLAALVPPRERGELVGTLQGFALLAAAASPTVSGALMTVNVRLPFVTAGVMALVSTLLIHTTHERAKAAGPPQWAT